VQVIASSQGAGAPALELPELDTVRHLGERFPEAHLREVVVVRASELDVHADRARRVRVWVALECLQTTGSFKVRGALVALDAIRRRQGKGARVIAASAGNHGAGVAYAARVLGLAATVVVPAGVPRAKRSRILDYGATVVLAESDSYDDAESRAMAMAAETGATFVSPYDDPDVVAGNGSSLGFEIARAMGKVPDLVLAPLGGGGLATGLAHAFAHDSKRPEKDHCVWGVQSEASPAMALSLQRGSAVERLALRGPTLAEGLEGGISRRAFEKARAAVAGVIVISEVEVANAMRYAVREMGVVVEGSAAVVLAPVLHGLPEGVPRSPSSSAAPGIDLVAVLTGRNVDGERLASVTRSGEHPVTRPPPA
jgi:threonine dehydratase